MIKAQTYIILVFLALLSPLLAAAEPIDVLPVNGVLKDRQGKPISGLKNIRFALYDSKAGGTELWHEIYDGQDKIPINKGKIGVYLGLMNTLDFATLIDAPEIWLGIQVEDDSEMTRVQIASVIFATEARTCRQVGSFNQENIQPLLSESNICPQGSYFVGWNKNENKAQCEELAEVCQTGSYNDLVDAPTASEDLCGPNYSAGAGLTLSNDRTFDMDQATLEYWAGEVCYNSPTEVKQALEGVYAPSQHTHNWTELKNIPPGFADDVDNDTTYTAGKGLELVGTEFRAKGSPFAREIIVAKQGGDYQTVTAAIDAVTDASAESPALIRIMPGLYNESVTLKPHVHLAGSGQDVTIISSKVGNPAYDTRPLAATLVLASNTSVRSLNIENIATERLNIGVVAPENTLGVLLNDIKVHATGFTASTSDNEAIVILESSADIVLKSINAEASNSNQNIGLSVKAGATIKIYGGTYRVVSTEQGNSDVCADISGTIDAEGMVCQAIGDYSTVTALYIYGSGRATVRGGRFDAQSTGFSTGINFTGAYLAAYGVQASGRNGINNWGLSVNSAGNMVVERSTFNAEGGNIARGISLNGGEKGHLLDGVRSTAKGAIDGNIALTVTGKDYERVIRGGMFVGRDGYDAYGILCQGNVSLSGTYISAINGSIHNYGLWVNGGNATVAGAVLEGVTNSVWADSNSAVTVQSSRLVGGATTGPLQCVAVSRNGNFGATSCP